METESNRVVRNFYFCGCCGCYGVGECWWVVCMLVGVVVAGVGVCLCIVCMVCVYDIVYGVCILCGHAVYMLCVWCVYVVCAWSV